MYRGMGYNQVKKGQDSRRMDAAAVSERRLQLLGSGGILQTIYLQFHFEGQILDRSDEGWNSMAMDRTRAANFSIAQEQFNNDTWS